MVNKITVNKNVNYSKDVYVTSDGIEFDELVYAEMHEFEYVKLNRRYIFSDNEVVIDVENKEDLEKFISKNYYSDTKLCFNYDDLTFPNTYVLVESLDEIIENNGEDDIWLREKTKLEMYGLDEYKQNLIEYINKFN